MLIDPVFSALLVRELSEGYYCHSPIIIMLGNIYGASSHNMVSEVWLLKVVSLNLVGLLQFGII